jgi:hypothetical protein
LLKKIVHLIGNILGTVLRGRKLEELAYVRWRQKAVDREERGQGSHRAVEEVGRKLAYCL